MRRMNSLILPLFTLSGTSALIYQIVWIRLLSHLLGGTSLCHQPGSGGFHGGAGIW